jgi:organic radical activating enzyme
MSSLENIYISPLELCNLRCLYCYTKKTKSILTNDQILNFIDKYPLPLKSIIFCGGEVLTLKDFPTLVNLLIKKNIFITIITNGTIDRLDEIDDPRNCQLIVSFDGPEEIHDANRGAGNFIKSKKFVAKALKLGFPIEIFYLITKDSYPYKDKLNIFGQHITYMTDRLNSLTSEQVKDIRHNYPCYPPADFGCNMLSLQSDGRFYGCCESTKSIGSLTDSIDQVIEKYTKLIKTHPLCSDPEFKCHL